MFKDQGQGELIPSLILVGFTAAPWLGNVLVNNIKCLVLFCIIPYPAGIGRKVNVDKSGQRCGKRPAVLVLEWSRAALVK